MNDTKEQPPAKPDNKYNPTIQPPAKAYPASAIFTLTPKVASRRDFYRESVARARREGKECQHRRRFALGIIHNFTPSVPSST